MGYQGIMGRRSLYVEKDPTRGCNRCLARTFNVKKTIVMQSSSNPIPSIQEPALLEVND